MSKEGLDKNPYPEQGSTTTLTRRLQSFHSLANVKEITIVLVVLVQFQPSCPHRVFGAFRSAFVVSIIGGSGR